MDDGGNALPGHHQGQSLRAELTPCTAVPPCLLLQLVSREQMDAFYERLQVRGEQGQRMHARLSISIVGEAGF